MQPIRQWRSWSHYLFTQDGVLERCPVNKKGWRIRPSPFWSHLAWRPATLPIVAHMSHAICVTLWTTKCTLFHWRWPKHNLSHHRHWWEAKMVKLKWHSHKILADKINPFPLCDYSLGEILFISVMFPRKANTRLIRLGQTTKRHKMPGLGVSALSGHRQTSDTVFSILYLQQSFYSLGFSLTIWVAIIKRQNDSLGGIQKHWTKLFLKYNMQSLARLLYFSHFFHFYY